MRLNQEQLASIILLVRMGGGVQQESLHHGRCDLRMIANLQGHNPSELAGRLSNDIGKVAVQRQENCPEIPGLGDNRESGDSPGMWSFSRST